MNHKDKADLLFNDRDDVIESSEVEGLAARFTYALDKLKISTYSADSDFSLEEWFLDPLDVWVANSSGYNLNIF